MPGMLAAASSQLSLGIAFSGKELPCLWLCPLLRGSPHLEPGQYGGTKAQPLSSIWDMKGPPRSTVPVGPSEASVVTASRFNTPLPSPAALAYSPKSAFGEANLSQ